jgi:hypothetical protein
MTHKVKGINPVKIGLKSLYLPDTLFRHSLGLSPK